MCNIVPASLGLLFFRHSQPGSVMRLRRLVLCKGKHQPYNNVWVNVIKKYDNVMGCASLTSIIQQRLALAYSDDVSSGNAKW